MLSERSSTCLRTRTSPPRPQFAVISVGYRSPLGHPRMDVLERLQQAHIKTFRTDTMGAVTFYLDGSQITPHLPIER